MSDQMKIKPYVVLFTRDGERGWREFANKAKALEYAGTLKALSVPTRIVYVEPE